MFACFWWRGVCKARALDHNVERFGMVPVLALLASLLIIYFTIHPLR